MESTYPVTSSEKVEKLYNDFESMFHSKKYQMWYEQLLKEYPEKADTINETKQQQERFLDKLIELKDLTQKIEEKYSR